MRCAVSLGLPMISADNLLLSDCLLRLEELAAECDCDDVEGFLTHDPQLSQHVAERPELREQLKGQFAALRAVGKLMALTTPQAERWPTIPGYVIEDEL